MEPQRGQAMYPRLRSWDMVEQACLVATRTRLSSSKVQGAFFWSQAAAKTLASCGALDKDPNVSWPQFPQISCKDKMRICTLNPEPGACSQEALCNAHRCPALKLRAPAWRWWQGQDDKGRLRLLSHRIIPQGSVKGVHMCLPTPVTPAIVDDQKETRAKPLCWPAVPAAESFLGRTHVPQKGDLY